MFVSGFVDAIVTGGEQQVLEILRGILDDTGKVDGRGLEGWL